MKTGPDLLARDCGNLWQFFPLSPEASAWIDEHVQTESWQWMGQSLVVDSRFAGALIEGAHAAGLEVRQ